MGKQPTSFSQRECDGLGALALGSLVGGCGTKSSSGTLFDPAHPLLQAASLPRQGKECYLFAHGGSAVSTELFDYKPELIKMMDRHVSSLLEGKRFASSGAYP